jgi:chromosome segregation ATPase
VNESTPSTMSFDRMRNMLMRAAEIRESEQQQIFDALDEIHARLSPLESLSSVRKRLAELPDRNEVSVLAERLDEALARLETQDGAISGLNQLVDGLTDRLAKPFAQLDGRLDGVTGRFEGVAGRMDGLEDKLGHIHQRLNELEQHLDKQDGRLESLPSAVHGPLRERLDVLETALRARLTEMDEGVHEHLDGTREALHRSVSEVGNTVGSAVAESRESVQSRIEAARQSTHDKVDQARDSLQGKLDATNDSMHGKLDDLVSRPAVDPSERLDTLTQRLEQVTSRLDEMAGRLDHVENGVTTRINQLAGAVDQGLQRVNRSVEERPDVDSLTSMVRDANEESERRHAGQLDEAMATFAELILGGGGPSVAQPPPALPRPQRRAGRKPSSKLDKGMELDDLDLDAEGA